MKAKVSVITLLALLLTALVQAYPGIGGGRGLLRVQNALVEDQAGLTFSAHALGRRPEFDTTHQKGWGVADLIAPELSYAPLAMKYVGLEVFGSWGGVFQKPKSLALDEFNMALHDLKAGGKLSIPVLPVLKLGAAASYTFMSPRGDDSSFLDPTAIPAVTDPPFSWRGLGTIQLQDLVPSLPNLMLNYGQYNDLTEYGFGAELASRGMSIFVEATSEQPEGSSGVLDTDLGHLHVTPGVMFGNTGGFGMKVAYTFSFGTDAPNEAILGLIVGTSFGQRLPPQIGTIAGSVTDARTGAPIAAAVNFPDHPKLLPLTASELGVFKAEKVPAGAVTVEVSAPGYQSQAIPIDVKHAAVAQYEFKLRPLVVYGVIAGTVTDATNNRPLEATVEFPGTEMKTVTTDPTTGAFRVDNVPVGVYTVSSVADKYVRGTLTVTVEEGRAASPIFTLSPLTSLTTMTGRVTDKKTGDPLAATINFVNTSVPAAATDPATGVYKGDVPVGAYTVQIEAKDYVKQTVALVLEKDKPMVRDFELVKVGMVITLKNIYFDFNKATIKLPQSTEALQGAAKILTENPTINVEIQGHTDNVGSDEYNQGLSERRAKSVVDYLVKTLGIAPERLVGKGYGEAKPKDTNETEAGRALNRRVEFVIVGETQK